MALDLMKVNVLPGPLNPFSTGDRKADAAIARLQGWELGASDPRATPGGKDYDQTVKAAAKAPPQKLLLLLDDAACDTGHAHWDDDALDRLGIADKRAFRKHYDAVTLAEKTRKGYLAWLMRAVLPASLGLDRVLALGASPKARPAARVVAADTLWHVAPEARRKVADALDPHRWDGKDGVGQHCMLWRVYRTGAFVQNAIDQAEAFDRLSDLFTVPAVKSAPGKARADAALSGLMHGDAIDVRWNAALAPLLKTALDVAVLMTLKKAPADPALVEPLCAYLGKSPDKITYFNDDAVSLLARVANARALPYLVAALHDNWMHYPAVFEGFRTAGDPAMAAVLRAWLVDNGDGPKGERTKLGESIARELEARAKKAGTAITPFVAPAPPEEPAPERPVLRFKKCKSMKLPKLETLATLERHFAHAFREAKLAKHLDRIARRAVWLVPTRVDESKLALGATKLGGHPELEAKTAWPRVKGEPLTFLGQVRLEEMAPHLPKGLAPPAGLLAFFVGKDPNSARAGYLEQARVLFVPPKTKLVRRAVPDDFTDEIFQACRVRPIATLSLPSPSNRHVTSVLNEEECRRYEDDVVADTPALPQFLGYRNHGYDAEEPASAQLVLQLTGDSQSDMEFGDCDYLSIFMDERKLRAGDFSKVWPHVGD